MDAVDARKEGLPPQIATELVLIYNYILTFFGENNNQQLQTRAIQQIMRIQQTSDEFRLCYDADERQIGMFNLKRLIYNAEGNDKKRIIGEFIMFITRKQPVVQYKDFGLDDADVEFLKKKEIIDLWSNIHRI